MISYSNVLLRTSITQNAVVANGGERVSVDAVGLKILIVRLPRPNLCHSHGAYHLGRPSEIHAKDLCENAAEKREQKLVAGEGESFVPISQVAVLAIDHGKIVVEQSHAVALAGRE